MKLFATIALGAGLCASALAQTQQTTVPGTAATTATPGTPATAATPAVPATPATPARPMSEAERKAAEAVRQANEDKAKADARLTRKGAEAHKELTAANAKATLVLRPTDEWSRFRCPFDGAVTHVWWTCTDAIDRGRWAVVLAGVADPALVAEAVSRN